MKGTRGGRDAERPGMHSHAERGNERARRDFHGKGLAKRAGKGRYACRVLGCARWRVSRGSGRSGNCQKR